MSNTPPVSVALLSNFGPQVRGVSHYSDHLSAGLQTHPDLNLTRIDYQAAFPGFLLPAVQAQPSVSGPTVQRLLHWGKPSTWRQVAQINAQILHLQYWSPFSSYYLLGVARQAQRLGKKVVLTVHNPAPHESLGVFSFWERRLMTEVDALIVHTQSGVQNLVSRFPRLRADRIYVIPHGVPMMEAQTAQDLDVRQELGVSDSQRLLVTFGNLRGYKGIPVLLKAWQSLSTEFPDVTLVIAGRLWSGGKGLSGLVGRFLGGQKVEAEVKALLAAEGVTGRTVFREGFAPEKLIDALCQQADLGVFPHERMAGQSGAVTRAVGAGLPVLVSRVGGLPDVAMDDRFIVPPGESDSLAQALRQALALDLSALRSSQQQKAFKLAWPNIAAQHAKLYRRLQG